MKQKAFWGLLLLLTAISLILYGIGLGPSLLGMPIHRLIFALILIALIFAKVVFSNQLRERFKVFTLSSFLFMILETDIARWFSLSDENIINNWLLFLAALLADTAMGIIIPKGRRTKSHSKYSKCNIHFENSGKSKEYEKNIFGQTTVYIDANTTKHSNIDNKFGEMVVFYQNTDICDSETTMSLEIDNKFGEVCVHVPENWNIENEMHSYFGDLDIRTNTSNGPTLIVSGSNSFGETKII